MQMLVEAAKNYIRTLFAENTDGHGFGHSMRVYRNALLILETEPEADQLVVSLGALLHDADDHKLFHTENNANARRFLHGQGISPETEERICEAVNSVSFSQNGDKRPATAEGRIIQDADRLDAIGAVGVARCFAFGGEHGRAMEESVQHFYDKLLLLAGEMNTMSAKRLAQTRHAFLELFLKEYAEETAAQQEKTKTTKTQRLRP